MVIKPEVKFCNDPRAQLHPTNSHIVCFFFQAEDGIRYHCVTGVQTCALPIYFVPSRPGDEMLAFTNSGAVYDVRPPAGDEGGFVMEPIGDLGSRVRDAVLVPGAGAK